MSLCWVSFYRMSLCWVSFYRMSICWESLCGVSRSVIDVEHNNKECITEDNVTQHKEIRYNNTWHISFYMLNVLYAECHLCWRSWIALNAACRYSECRYAECHYTECRYAECRRARDKTHRQWLRQKSFIRLLPGSIDASPNDNVVVVGIHFRLLSLGRKAWSINIY